MKIFAKLAIRNVHRNIKSTLLNGVGITLAVFVLLLVFSLSKGIETQIITRNIRFETGAFSVALDKKMISFNNEVRGDALFEKMVAFLTNHSQVTGYSFRVDLPSNNLYFNDNSQSVYVTGMSKQEIPLIEEMLKIQKGDTRITDTKGIVISNAVAESLNLEVGNYCNLMSQTVDGSMNLDEFVVKGIFRYTSQMNKWGIFMDYDEAKKLYYTNLPSRIIVNVKDLNGVKNLKHDFLKSINYIDPHKEGVIEYKGLKVASYLDTLGMAKTLSRINRYTMLSIASFLVLISFIGIWSMQTENVNERYREIGSLLSFGFKTASVKKIFVYETFYISCIFYGVGLFAVFLFVSYINSQNGIYLGDSASFAFGSTIINPILSWKHIISVFIITVMYPLIATLLSLMTLNKKKIVILLNN